MTSSASVPTKLGGSRSEDDPYFEYADGVVEVLADERTVVVHVPEYVPPGTYEMLFTPLVGLTPLVCEGFVLCAPMLQRNIFLSLQVEVEASQP
ncbi:MAG: hypothetical protein GY822_12055 [Deltaproteobacteria bacterium]|nr:hypothetical protein [Deltaproteobacteria bacterium]